MESGYFFSGPTLTNDVHLVSSKDIKDMLHQNGADRAECAEVTQGSMRGENYYNAGEDWLVSFFREVLYRDPKTNGFIMDMPHGKIIKQAERNHYYRGENQIYSESLPSLNRDLNAIPTEMEKRIYRIIADMRLFEFRQFLFKFKHVQLWEESYGTVLFESLAQHYGLKTHWLDITNDFAAALFFATCAYDSNKDEWHPLTKAETEGSEDKKYGLLYHIPTWRVHALQMTQIADNSGNAILPIGFQPFARCHMQYGYGIYMEADHPLQEDIVFEKLKFRHDEQLSAFAFNLMQKGNLIYPHEGLSEVRDIIETIATATDFTEEAFQYAFNKNAFFSTSTECRSLVEGFNINGQKISVGNKCPYELSRQRRRRIDQRYANFSLEKDYHITPMTRMCFVP